MRAWHFALMTIVVMGLGSKALAQPPAPYGAWRGKIHYVEGPYRTRMHVRWGGGITPVGGQVLMHLGTVAGNVATSPDFWGGMGGLPGPARDAAPSPALLAAVADVQAQSPALFAGLNEVRREVGLQPILPPAPPPMGPPTGGPGPVNGGPPADAITARLLQWNQHVDEIEELRTHLAQQIDIALKIGDMLGAEADAARVATLEDLKTKSVVRDVVTPLGAVEPSTEAFEQAYQQIAADVERLIPMLQACVEQGHALFRLDSSLRRPEREANVENCQRWLDECRQVRL